MLLSDNTYISLYIYQCRMQDFYGQAGSMFSLVCFALRVFFGLVGLVYRHRQGGNF